MKRGNVTAQIAALDEFNINNRGAKFDLSGVQCYAKCIKVYDGDTVTLTFPFMGIYYYASCRCLGYNTAEIRTKDLEEKQKAIEARDLVRDLILDHVVLAEFGPNDKYGRPLVEIKTIRIKKHRITRKTKVIVGASLKDVLISANLAAEYYGSGEKNYA